MDKNNKFCVFKIKIKNDIDDNKKDDDDDDVDDDRTERIQQNNISSSELIEFYECKININKLHETLLDLICNVQFSSTIRRMDIVNVPFKDPVTQIKTSLSIPMVCCIDNINHQHLYNRNYLSNYDIECNSEYHDITNLHWCKVPESSGDNKFDFSDWITRSLVLITPSKLDDTSRLLMKFINKKKLQHYEQIINLTKLTIFCKIKT